MPTASNRLSLVAWVLLAGLIAFRLPSLVQPAGADQALYTYIGQRILAGGVPYRDAWDQKPPGVHLAYAGLVALWPHESVVAGADLAVAALTALALIALGRRLSSSSGAGEVAAAAFLLLGNPAMGRLGGLRVRAQCEVFLALAVAAALLAVWRAIRSQPANRGWLLISGALLGVAVVFKYNAVAYALPLLVMVAGSPAADSRPGLRTIAARAGWIAVGATLPVVLMLAWLGGAGALDDLYRATILYNVRYSGETYGGRLHMLRYLVTFPVAYARVDPLWFVGGLGAVVMVGRAVLARAEGGARNEHVLHNLVAPAWIAAACAAIAINGSRGLPQYFVQAGPALALAAGLAASWAWGRMRWAPRLLVAALLAVAVVRVASFPKLLESTRYDFDYMRGRMTRSAYLSRFGNADSGDKYSALAVAELASLVATRTNPADRVLVFGFSPWAYVGSNRVSASRFFWSRPVIIGFEQGRAGYGSQGVLDEVTRQDPKLVVLQERDWDPDVTNSADFFLADPVLSPWLRRGYQQTDRLHNFQIWTRIRQ